MRTIAVDQIRDAICRMVQRINIEYPDDIRRCMETALQKEQHPTARSTLQFLIRNAAIAREERLPICQDTGMAVIFLRVGQDVHFTGGSLRDAIDQGVAMGYEQGYLRKSVVDDPLFERINTRTNTPAIVYTEICEGDQVEILVGAKGFGSENMSTITMLKPAQGIQGVKDAVLSAIRQAGPNACPPMVVGVGIGGTFDYAAMLAKKATLREALHSKDPRYAALEEELLQEANALGIGPQGLGGDTSVFRINIEHYPTHIAGLPCAVNISCHVTRHAKEVL
ncbi:fumarate hydratase [Amedibacillus dolichus]|uniref:Fumarate hydratase n=1 Tax=Amedibacillus dolichus TaxID=31971 RepID=A0ABT7UDY6_9FIRM|nr:fumarate hydratase [Amedibacillus dolichus]MDM8157832.1 fumarate hydratase [Amedibacillus dolichus]